MSFKTKSKGTKGSKPPPDGRAKPRKSRLDASLVSLGLAQDLGQARAMIMAGEVVVDDQRIDQIAAMISEEAQVRLKTARSEFVGRGGEKLQGAIDDLGLKDAWQDKVVLDVGASTGGFTQCCLKHGAKLVVALDVGTNQLAWELRNDPRVIALENTDLRAFVKADYPPLDWVVADISFNSTARLVPALVQAGAPETRFLVLVKPQFELPKAEVPEGGVVDDPQLRQKALDSVIAAFATEGLVEGRAVEARLPGRAGNQEIFYLVSGGRRP